MGRAIMRIWDAHGNHLPELYLLTHGWMLASGQRVGITGIHRRKKGVHASMNISVSGQGVIRLGE